MTTVQEAGHKGGSNNLKKHGLAWFKELNKKSQEAKKKKKEMARN